MLTPIILEYNKKYLNLESLYKLNLYFIDNEYYIDMSEVEKFEKNIGDRFETTVSDNYIDDEEEYDEEQRKLNDQIYIERSKYIHTEGKKKYKNLSIENYLLNLVETSYSTILKVFDKYKEHLYNLNNFKKPNNLFKQIISENGEIIYIINFKKEINNINYYEYAYIHKYSNTQEELIFSNYNIKIEIESIFDINKIYPLDLKKILTEKKIKVSPYTEL